jgi:hypothetical protein
MLCVDGLPLAPLKCPIRMRVAFWVPQKAPYQRRSVKTWEDYLRSLVDGHVAAHPLPAGEKVGTLRDYARKFRLDEAALAVANQPEGYTFVRDTTRQERQALNDGVIVEQLQDFTFPRQPTLAEMRQHMYPHWELRTLHATGAVPNAPPVERQPRVFVGFGA